MRRSQTLVTVMAALGSVAALALGGCYNPGDLGATPFACTPMYPDCPDNYTCQLNPNLMNLSKCVSSSGGGVMGAMLSVHVDKTGPAYTGPTSELGLSAGRCPASGFNFNLASAFPLDGNTSTPTLYLCRPDEADVYHVAVAGAPQYMRVKVGYPIAAGDLDLAFLDERGAVVDSDGSAHDGACLATRGAVSALDLAVVGAGGKATNKYTVAAELSATPLSCN